MLPRMDLVLTDPPYGHGDKWAGGTWAANPIYDAAFEWDAEPIDDQLMAMVIGSAVKGIVWGGNYYTLPPSRSWLVWEKTQKMSTMADCELAWTNLDQPSRLYRETRNPDGQRQHPTQKPLSVMRWCLFQAQCSTGVVIDPFMGVGTTLVAAKAMRLRAIGIETERKYCDIAIQRLEQDVLPFSDSEFVHGDDGASGGNQGHLFGDDC